MSRKAKPGAPGAVDAPADRVDVEAAIEVLGAEGLLAFPTETVWGLGARAVSAEAVRRLQAFKGRDAGQPISVLVDSSARLGELGVAVEATARAVLDAFWPGPLTLVLAASSASPFAAGIAGPRGAIGFRCSNHPKCRALVEAGFAAGLGPITATSFNRSGDPPVQTFHEALGLAGSDTRAPVVCLDPGPDDALAEAPSTVLDLSVTPPRVLRWGAIGESALAAVVGDLEGVGVKR